MQYKFICALSFLSLSVVCLVGNEVDSFARSLRDIQKQTKSFSAIKEQYKVEYPEGKVPTQFDEFMIKNLMGGYEVQLEKLFNENPDSDIAFKNLQKKLIHEIDEIIEEDIAEENNDTLAERILYLIGRWRYFKQSKPNDKKRLEIEKLLIEKVASIEDKDIDVYIKIPANKEFSGELIEGKTNECTILYLVLNREIYNFELIQLLLNKGADPFKTSTWYTGYFPPTREFVNIGVITANAFVFMSSSSSYISKERLAKYSDKIDFNKEVFYVEHIMTPLYVLCRDSNDYKIIIAMLKAYQKIHSQKLNAREALGEYKYHFEKKSLDYSVHDFLTLTLGPLLERRQKKEITEEDKKYLEQMEALTTYK